MEDFEETETIKKIKLLPAANYTEQPERSLSTGFDHEGILSDTEDLILDFLEKKGYKKLSECWKSMFQHEYVNED